MATARFEFDGEVWEHDGSASWFFVSLPEPIADEIEGTFGHRAKGFGSLRVEVTIGGTTWQTSIFPDTKRGTYVLPVKKTVRRAEELGHASAATIELAVLE